MTEKLGEGRFLKALRREPVDTTPLWIMRQAGRYLPEYRAIRRGLDFLDFCKSPDLASEATLSAQAVLGVDAAILFADLPTILEPIGFDLSYRPGPQVANPFRGSDDLVRIREFEDLGTMEYVYETVRRVRAGLPEDIPLIGFAGAPFTLASYAIEGAGSKNYAFVKAMMYRRPEVWDEFAGLLSRAITKHLIAQFEAGCQVVQLFDSWAGALGPVDYEAFVLPHLKRVIEAVEPYGPVINFMTGNPALLPLCASAGGAAVGLDWRVDLAAGWEAVGHDRAVQGNLDPIALLSDPKTLHAKVKTILDAAGGRPGHLFNLGHGILPETDPALAKALVDMVHEEGTRPRG